MDLEDGGEGCPLPVLDLVCEMPHVHGELATGDVEDGRAVEEGGELVRVHRGGHDDELEGLLGGAAAELGLLDDAEEDVGVDRALVGLIHHDPVVLGEQGV